MFQLGGNASGAAKDWVICLKRGIPLVLRTKKLVLIDDSSDLHDRAGVFSDTRVASFP